MNIERLTTRAGARAFSQGRAVYRGARVPGGVVHDITAVLDRSYEVFDEDGVARRVTVMAVQVSQVPSSERGDTIERDGRSWQVIHTLEDDGHDRVLEVT
ncbi:hypothetical protein [Salinisphaera sp. T31B1]|uniref:head-tail joining protein n=1 Tax=Salinisphaera sp. T31B1 TaxID=727963 RepID=UPI00333F48D2